MMDSIEKMRRLNQLTKELKQRGFAESSFEAIQQANQIYGDDELTEGVKNGMIQSPQEKASKIEGDNMADSIEFDRKIGKLNENVEMLTGKINEIVKAINDIDGRITAIKNRPAERIIERPVERHESNEMKQEVHESVAEQQASTDHAQAPKDEYSTNQRTGTYKPTDVAIDKMFYYGKK